MQTYAAVDIGSNSCRLKIASVQRHRLKTLHEDREVTRLGESVFDTGVVSPDSMALTIRALKRFLKAIQANAVDQIRVVATSAIRDARNQAEFIAWVKSATGWNVEIISGLEEGRLIQLGLVSVEPAARGRCILIDLGGGSCEVTLSDAGRIREIVSLPLGAVRLTREFLRSDPPTKEQITQMKTFISREVGRAEKRLAGQRARIVIATSGTAAALAAASRQMAKLPKGKRARTEEYAEATHVKKLAAKLTKMSDAARAQVPGIGPRRSEIIVAGSHVYAELVDRLDLPGFQYSPAGLRDGVLALMLAQQDEHTSAHQRFETERWEGVLELCRRYGVDPKRQLAVRNRAVQLFREMQNVHNLPEEYSFWLEAAALMHEVGKFMNYQGHHRHTQYIIANSELYGFAPEQRAIVSAIARYLGKSRPSAQDRLMRLIPPAQHANVERAIVLLRLAVALKQGRASLGTGELQLPAIRTRVFAKRVTLELLRARSAGELELWALRKEAGYFREVFRRDLFVELV
jgi:exopolyphosphatase/guanosine-5'-triphosphate,3'-diphosphate pyrophosphatase